VRLFVSEYTTSGAWTGELIDESLVCEGNAMLTAILADFARVPDCRVVTTRDARLEPLAIHGVEVLVATNALEEQQIFYQLAADCDATFVIAPEFEHILADRRELVDHADGRFLGSSLEAIELCSDKLRLAEFLAREGYPTIETESLEPERFDSELPFPIVVKPRDGAGSLNTRLVSNRTQFNALLQTFATSSHSRPLIWQPFVAGMPLSVAVMVSQQHGRLEVFPTAKQRLSTDGRFHYLGGRIPYSESPSQPIRQLVCNVCNSIPGLGGYVGIDLIVPIANDHEPLIVEINPRLTTSYLGYRRLADENLAEWFLATESRPQEISWNSNSVTYNTEGAVTVTVIQ